MAFILKRCRSSFYQGFQRGDPNNQKCSIRACGALTDSQIQSIEKNFKTFKPKIEKSDDDSSDTITLDVEFPDLKKEWVSVCFVLPT